MVQDKNWSPPSTGADVMGQMEKRVRREERRPLVRKAADLMGPSLGPYAVEVEDLNDEAATFNGILSVPIGALNGPLSTVPLVGEVHGIAGVGGRQTLSTYRAIDAPHRTWARTYNYIAGTTTIIWGDWVEGAGADSDEGRGTTTERNIAFGNPGTNAQIAELANRQVRWYNTTTRRFESFFAASTVTGLTVPALLSGHASGWYPEAGTLLHAHRGKTNGFQAVTAGTVTQVALGTMQRNVGGFTSDGTSGFAVPVGGYYNVTARTYFSGVPSEYVISLLFVGGAQFAGSNNFKPGNTDVTVTYEDDMPLVAGAVLSLRALAAVATSAWGPADGYQGSALSAKYLGPPVAS